MYLIMYDIESNKTRAHFSKFLQKYGRRVQYSVFEIFNSNRILSNIETEIKSRFECDLGQADSILIYQISDDSCIRKYGYPLNNDTDLLIM